MVQMKVSGKWPTPSCCFCRHTFSHCFQSRSICFISMFNCQLMTFHLSFACCLARSVFDWQWHLPVRIFSCFTCTDLWLINVCSALTPTHTANYSPASLPCLFLLLHFACRFCLSDCLSRTFSASEHREKQWMAVVRHHHDDGNSRRKKCATAEAGCSFLLAVASLFSLPTPLSFTFANSLIINLFIYRFANSRSHVSLSLFLPLPLFPSQQDAPGKSVSWSELVAAKLCSVVVKGKIDRQTSQTAAKTTFAGNKTATAKAEADTQAHNT